jgi:hypothetical protein
MSANGLANQRAWAADFSERASRAGAPRGLDPPRRKTVIALS